MVTAPGRYDYAELIAALWTLGAAGSRMPTSHGILDAALRSVVGRADFPSQFRDGLTFGVTSVGLRCFELPDILLAAQETHITTEPNPTYLTTEVTLDNDSARQIVVGAGLTTRSASELGRALKDAVQELQKGLASESDRMVAA